MKRMTKRREDGQAVMDCFLCADQGVVCHLLSCRNRLKNRLCEYEDVMQSNGLVEQKHGRWVDRYGGKYANPLFECSECKKKAPYKFENDSLRIGLWLQDLSDYCPNCGAKMDGGSNG